MRKFTLAACVSLFLSHSVFAEIVTEEINYELGNTTLTGFMAYDDSINEKTPGILVVHEWWGHNEYVRERAKQLAELGYTAFALDMYGDGKLATHPDDAKAFMTQALDDKQIATARFQSAMELLQQQETVDAKKISAIGYCFGGGVVLNMARQGMDLDSVVSFHGSLAPYSPAQPGNVKAKILVLNGADDPFVSSDAIDEFKKEMNMAEADYEFVNYPGAVHSFTNPGATEVGEKHGMPLAYSEQADKQSWEAMKALFAGLYQ